jgi:PTS system fructose-specific IIC component
MSSVSQWIEHSFVHPNLGATQCRGVIYELTGLIVRVVPHIDPNILAELLEKRENLQSTAILEGVAFPQAEVPGIDRPYLALACSKNGVDFQSLDGLDTHLFIVIIVPQGDQKRIAQILARLVRLIKKDQKKIQTLIDLKESDDLFQSFISIEKALDHV